MVLQCHGFIFNFMNYKHRYLDPTFIPANLLLSLAIQNNYTSPRTHDITEWCTCFFPWHLLPDMFLNRFIDISAF